VKAVNGLLALCHALFPVGIQSEQGFTWTDRD